MSIPYTHIDIDRQAELRKSTEAVDQLLQSPKALLIPTANDLNLIRPAGEQPELVKFPMTKELHDGGCNPIYLGTSNDHYLFNLDYSHSDNGQLQTLNTAGEFTDLRKIGATLTAQDAALALYARGIQHWHLHHQFCARCGSKTISTEGGHSRTCHNETCKHVTYPRISPAVIVLVEYRPPNGQAPMCLLGKGNRAWGNVRSTLAGFTEIGESLEETVRREMKEEAGIDVYNIRYMGSQPWPFPSSLMVGFFAETGDTTLELDTDEVLEADWYTVTDLREQVRQGKLTLSREDSIARFLITTWMAQNS